MVLTIDKLTSLLGVAGAVTHQLGIVPIVPITRQDWMNTGTSVVLGLLGYFIAKR